MTKKTRVCIGVPVYNGEKYLSQALDSILAQKFTDFEIILSDNASTDKTEQICRKYVTRDSRVIYYRNESNVGASKNFNRAFKLSSAEYFKWAAYDDILAPEFLLKCVRVLDSDPSIVLCHSKTTRINEYGSYVGNYDLRFLRNASSFKTHERFRDLISIRNPCWAIFGVYRTEALAKTQLMGEYIGADRNLLAEIGLVGRIYEIPEYLFFRRDHADAYTRKYCEQRYAVAWDNYSEQMKYWSRESFHKFPYWKHLIEYIKSIKNADLDLSERLLCYSELLDWFLKEGLIFLMGDIENAILGRSKIGRKIITAIRIVRKQMS